MENIDIKNFQPVSTVDLQDDVLLARSTGSHGRMKVELFRQAVMEGLTPNVREGKWYVGETATGVDATGKTPVLETGTVGTGAADTDVQASVEYERADDNGNPVYSLNFVIPRGKPGADGVGAGNVHVEASGLKSTKKYLFMPLSDDSANGQMVEYTEPVIPVATSSADGLMPHAMFSKLDRIKNVLAFPTGVLDLTPESTSEEISGLFADLEYPLEFIIVYYAAALKGNYDATLPPKVFIGNVETFVSGGDLNMDGSDVASASLYVSYIDNGVLSTIILSLVMEDNSPVFSFKKESTSEEFYYLDKALADAKVTWGNEDIITAFGGTDKVEEFLTEVYVKGRKPYIISHSADLLAGSGRIIPITATFVSFGMVVFRLSFISISPADSNSSKKVEISGSYTSTTKAFSNGSVNLFYYPCYTLNKSLYTLTLESSSDDISAAVGGESGLRTLIQLAKSGNRLAVPYTIDADSPINGRSELLSVVYQEADTGDMIFAFYVSSYLVMGVSNKAIIITYTKSDNTFNINIADL